MNRPLMFSPPSPLKVVAINRPAVDHAKVEVMLEKHRFWMEQTTGKLRPGEQVALLDEVIKDAEAEIGALRRMYP